MNDVQRGLAENLGLAGEPTISSATGSRRSSTRRSSTSASWTAPRGSCTSRTRSSAVCAIRTSRSICERVRSLTRHVIETRETVLINDACEERVLGFGGDPIVGSGEAPKSMLFVPLVVGGEATGRISLQNLDREHAFTEADARLLTTLAASLSVALENVRLFDESAASRERDGGPRRAGSRGGRSARPRRGDPTDRRTGEGPAAGRHERGLPGGGPGRGSVPPARGHRRRRRADHGGRDPHRRGCGRRPGEPRCRRGRERSAPAIRGRSASRARRRRTKNA